METLIRLNIRYAWARWLTGWALTGGIMVIMMYSRVTKKTRSP